MWFKPIFDLFLCPSFSSLKLELQLLNKKDVYEINKSYFQGLWGKLSKVAMNEPEKRIAGDATKEIILNHLLLNALGGLIQLNTQHGS